MTGLVVSGPSNHFVPTSITAAIDHAASYAIRFGRAAAITGPPGIGKSTALRRLAADHPNALYGDASKFPTRKPLFEFIVDGYGLHVSGNRSLDNLRGIIEAHIPDMTEAGCVLFIDEMQDFELHTLKAVVNFSEECRLPVVLVGNERSLRARPRMDMDTFGQVLSRISKSTRLKSPTLGDYADFTRSLGIVDPGVITAAAIYGERTSFRNLRDLLDLAIQGAGSAEATNLTGLRAALVFMTDDAESGRLLKAPKKAA